MSYEVGKLYIQFDADGRPYIQGLKDIDRRTQQFQRDQQSAFDRFGSKLGSAIKTGMAVGAAAVVAGGVAITRSLIKAAASYEYEMSRIKAVTKASDAQVALMSKHAIQLGKDTVFSAGEAAQGMNELAKAGVSIPNIVGGAIQSTLALASAGELEVARAAEIVSNAMNVFGLAGDQAMRVADAMATAANDSSLEVEDLALSFAYAGPMAAQLGIPLEQVIASLAELGNVGIKGEMAGTGLRGMLASLISPSQVARDAMADLNVELADTEGNIKPLPDILDEFRDGLAGMTEAQQMELLGKIFDTQQLGVAMQLIKGGSEDLEEWTEKVSEAGEAERVAAEKMDNFKGSVEQLRGSAETLAIKAGTPLINWLREGVDGLTEATNWAADFYEELTNLSGWEGADLTGKLKIAWDKLEEDFTTWFEGMNPIPAKVYPVFEQDGFGKTQLEEMIGVPNAVIKAEIEFAESRDTGEEKLMAMGAKIGRGAADLMLGVLGATDSDSVWAKAGKAIAEGFWQAFWGAVKMNPQERQEWNENTGGVAVPWNDEESGKASGKVYGDGFMEALWGVVSEGWKAVFGGDNPEVEEGAEQTGQKAADAMVVPLTERVSAAILSALGFDTTQQTQATDTGRRSGGAFFSGFSAEVQARLDAWKISPRSFFSLGSATGGGMTDAELMTMLGLGGGAYGDTGGLMPQTSAFWGMLHAAFPATSLISGYRASDPYPDHPSGTALDITVPGMQVALADAVARWAVNSGMARYVIWNRQTWWPGGGRTTYSHNNEDPHTSHLHIRTYDQGGVLPPGYTMAANWTGVPEVIVPASLTADIGDLIAAIKESVDADAEVADAILEKFSARSQLAESYTSRERARYGMMDAQGADSGALATQLGVVMDLLNDQIEEATAQLQAAKDAGLPQEDINALAGSLFDLRAEAADTAAEIEDLAMGPLRDLADAFGDLASRADSLMSLYGNSSDAYALQSGVFPDLMGALGGGYQTSLDMMSAATTPDDIRGFANDALGGLSDMFSAERDQLDRALDEATDIIDRAQDDWEKAWDARGEAIEDEHDREMAKLDEQEKAVQKKYDAQIQALRDYQDELQQAWEEEDRQEALRKLRRDLQELEAQGYYTEEDVRRMRDLREQIEAEAESLSREQQLEGIAARIAELERSEEEQVKAIELLRQQEQERYDTIVEAHEKEQEEKDRFFEQQREDAKAAYQAELDALVTKYASMMQTVIEQETKLLGEQGAYYNAGYALGKSFADGLLASIEAEIIPAASAAASGAADFLELNSPARLGDLSTLDHWWDDFAAMLTAPLRQDFMTPVMQDFTAPVMEGFHPEGRDGGSPRRMEVVIMGDPVQQPAIPEIARAVARELENQYIQVSDSWGRPR